MVSGEVDMATAELLAFGSLMLPFHPDDPIGRIKREERRSSLSDTTDAIHRSRPEFLVEYQDHPTVDVRLSGQDSERGTFNQRHAVIYDQTTAQPYTPLNNLGLGPQATLQAVNSSLSEAAVLGFEYAPPRTNWTRLVPPSVLTGHVSLPCALVAGTATRSRATSRSQSGKRSSGTLQTSRRSPPSLLLPLPVSLPYTLMSPRATRPRIPTKAVGDVPALRCANDASSRKREGGGAGGCAARRA